MRTLRSAREQFPSQSDLTEQTRILFENPGQEVDPEYIETNDEAERELENLILKINKDAEWDDQNTAISHAMSLIKGGALEFDSFRHGLNRVAFGISQAALNLRSALAKNACLLIAMIAQGVGQDIDSIFDFITPISGHIGHGTQIISESSKFAIIEIAKNCPCRKTMMQILELCKTRGDQKNAVGAECLFIALQRWNITILQRNSEQIEQTLNKILVAANPDVRMYARKALAAFKHIDSKAAQRILMRADERTRKAVAEENVVPSPDRIGSPERRKTTRAPSVQTRRNSATIVGSTKETKQQKGNNETMPPSSARGRAPSVQPRRTNKTSAIPSKIKKVIDNYNDQEETFQPNKAQRKRPSIGSEGRKFYDDDEDNEEYQPPPRTYQRKQVNERKVSEDIKPPPRMEVTQQQDPPQRSSSYANFEDMPINARGTYAFDAENFPEVPPIPNKTQQPPSSPNSPSKRTQIPTRRNTKREKRPIIESETESDSSKYEEPQKTSGRYIREDPISGMRKIGQRSYENETLPAGNYNRSSSRTQRQQTNHEYDDEFITQPHSKTIYNEFDDQPIPTASKKQRNAYDDDPERRPLQRSTKKQIQNDIDFDDPPVSSLNRKQNQNNFDDNPIPTVAKKQRKVSDEDEEEDSEQIAPSKRRLTTDDSYSSYASMRKGALNSSARRLAQSNARSSEDLRTSTESELNGTIPKVQPRDSQSSTASRRPLRKQEEAFEEDKFPPAPQRRVTNTLRETPRRGKLRSSNDSNHSSQSLRSTSRTAPTPEEFDEEAEMPSEKILTRVSKAQGLRPESEVAKLSPPKRTPKSKIKEPAAATLKQEKKQEEVQKRIEQSADDEEILEGDEPIFLETIQNDIDDERVSELEPNIGFIGDTVIRCCNSSDASTCHSGLNVLRELISAFPKQFESKLDLIIEMLLQTISGGNSRCATAAQLMLTRLQTIYPPGTLLEVTAQQIPSVTLLPFIENLVSTDGCDLSDAKLVQRLIAHAFKCSSVGDVKHRHAAGHIVAVAYKANPEAALAYATGLRGAQQKAFTDFVAPYCPDLKPKPIYEVPSSTDPSFLAKAEEIVSNAKGEAWISVRSKLFTEINNVLISKKEVDAAFKLVQTVFNTRGCDDFQLILRGILLNAHGSKTAPATAAMKSVMRTLKPTDLFKELTQYIVDQEVVIAKPAIDFCTHAFRKLDQGTADPIATIILQSLTTAFDSKFPEIRKAVVLCFAELYVLFGKENVSRFTSHLSKAQQKLILIYYQRRSEK